MRIVCRRTAALAACLAVLILASAIPVLAGDQTTLTKISGTVIGNGTWGRTIIDTEPNGPGGGTTQSVYVINTPWTNGMTAAQLAAAYKAQAALTLPPAPSNLVGFGTQNENSVTPTVRLGRQSGVYTYSDASLPPGMTVTTFAPFNAEHAPALSPEGLGALMASLTGLAWWARRRRRTV